jgi:hypothetical protein
MFLACQTAVFEVNGAHRAISSPELHTPTDYSYSLLNDAFNPVAPLSLDSNGDVVGGNDVDKYNGNGSGQVVLPSAFAVRSIKITNTSASYGAEDISWFNVCYDGLAPPTVTVNKVSKGGTGSFSFKGTGNANGFATDGSYTVTTASAGVAASGALVNLSAANTMTEIQEIVPPGWTLTGASCVDTNAAVSGNIASTFGVFTGTTLQIPAATVLAGANLQCTFTNAYTGLVVGGKVILDTGVGSGVAHDAVQNGVEQVQPGVTVSLTDCANTVYSSTTTASDGSFSLGLNGVSTGQQVCVVETLPAGYNSASANVGTTGGTYSAATGSLKFTVGANSYSGIVLGNVPMSTWTSDGAQQTAAGQAVVYAHTYVAGTAGSVTFSTTESPTPTGLIWTSTLYLDINCNGVLDGADTLLTGPVNVTPGQRVCVLDRVMSPAGAKDGVRDLTTVSASETWTILSPVGNLGHVLKNTDTTTVGASALTLLKEVRKIASCPVDANESINNTTAVYAFTGTANPGDWLEYRLRYTNTTAAALNSIVIHDQVPAYTRYGSALCLSIPGVGLSGCAVSQQPAAGASTGAIAWTLSDAIAAPVGLQPLASGSVSFCLQVQQ